MDIQQLISLDKELLLQYNGSDSLFWDGFMWIATNMLTWIPLAIGLLYVIFKNNKWKESLLIIVLLALVITFSDQISSGFCKPYFARFRPTQDPELMYQIDIVNGYRGGIYGFISAVCLLLVCIVTNIFASSQKDEAQSHETAIIMAPSVTVKSTPNEGGTDLFILHEGRNVNINDNPMREWKEIQLEDANAGSVPA